MTATEPTFLETITPDIRKVLVSARIAAMRGQIDEALKSIHSKIVKTTSNKHSDVVALGQLWSELLYLNGQDAEGLSTYKEFVEPLMSSLPTSAQLVAADNLSVLQMDDSFGDGLSTFYHSVDRRRVAKFEFSDSESLLVAQMAIQDEKYNEALPILWHNYLRAYGDGSWEAQRRAAGLLSKLFLKVGDLDLSCHYLLMARDDDGLKRLAIATALRGDPDIIRIILRRVMEFANLRRHFTVACQFIMKIPELIPDAEVENLAAWLLPRCRELADINGGGTMRAAWEAVRELGHRVSQSTSRKYIEAALSHPEWQADLPGENRVLPNRDVMVEAVTFLIHSATNDYLPEVTEATLPLAKERLQDYDYGAVVNLLCNLSQLGGAAIQNRIKTALFIPGQPVNRILAQVGSVFEVEALSLTQWEEFANRIIDEIRLTVQRLRPGEKPKPVAEALMALTRTSPEEQLHITIQSGVGLEALARGNKKLSDATIERVVGVLLDMATNRDNILSNRELLLTKLCDFADRANPDLSYQVVRSLEPLANGNVLESVDYPNSSAGQHPMSPIKMKMGTPHEVQAMALIAAATFCGSDAIRSRLIGDALFEGFVSPYVAVRRGAYTAARCLPGLSSEQLLPILMGLRDPDPKAAVSAFAAFADREEWSLTRPLWKLFLLATRLACQSPDSTLRRHAAVAMKKRLDQAPTAAIKIEAEAILKAFTGDLAYSVREAAQRE